MHRCSVARRRVLLLVIVAVTLVAASCAPPPPSGGGGGATTTYKNGRCAGSEGVTIVVDAHPLLDQVIVRCALGPQPSGLAVLANAGFTVTSEPGPGTVCTINGLPAEGFPYCWLTGGYWSYWKAASAGAPWTYSEWGAGAGPNPGPGHVEGWRFAPFDAGPEQPPRVGTSGPIVP